MQTTISDRWISNKKKTQQRLTQSLSLTRDSYENRIRSTTQTALSLNHLIQCLNFSTGKQLRAFILHQRRTTALFIHNFPQQCCFSIPHTFRNCPKKPRTSWRPRTSLPQDDDPSTTLSTLHFRPYFSWSPAQSNVLDRKVYLWWLPVLPVYSSSTGSDNSTATATAARRRDDERAKKCFQTVFVILRGWRFLELLPPSSECCALAISGCCTLWLEWLWMQHQRPRNLTGFTMRLPTLVFARSSSFVVDN